jgi:hypothetical protein
MSTRACSPSGHLSVPDARTFARWCERLRDRFNVLLIVTRDVHNVTFKSQAEGSEKAGSNVAGNHQHHIRPWGFLVQVRANDADSYIHRAGRVISTQRLHHPPSSQPSRDPITTSLCQTLKTLLQATTPTSDMNMGRHAGTCGMGHKRNHPPCFANSHANIYLLINNSQFQRKSSDWHHKCFCSPRFESDPGLLPGS